MKFFFSLAAILALLTFPETALNAAREAMYAWYASVAPALFPFMALMPMLTSPQSARAYEFLLGPLIRPLLKLPGAAAPAIVVGMTAGSPAGALAASRSSLSRQDKQRLVLCACGLSPAFLITGIGASMLKNPADGHILLRAQLFSQMTMLLLTRRSSDGEMDAPPQEDSAADPIRAAVSGVLAVCGYMIVFSVAAAVLAQILQSERAGLAALCLLDLPSAARALANLPINREAKLLFMAAATGLGGLCIAMQNLNGCKNIVRPGKYLAARLAHALLMTAATAFQLHFQRRTAGKSLPPMEISALIAVLLMVPTLFSWKKNLFLNKRNCRKRAEFLPEKCKKPQDIDLYKAIHPQYLVK